MRIVLLSSDSVLDGVVPIEVPVESILRDIVSIWFGQLGEEASGCEFGVFKQIGGGLFSGFGGVEDDAEEEVVMGGDCSKHGNQIMRW